MSIPVAQDVACPVCAERSQQRLYASLNSARAPAQVLQILNGTFEMVRCAGCQLAFQPQHTMQFVDPPSRTWIFMFPHSDRHQFAELEPDVKVRFERAMRAVPRMIAASMRPATVRLVFGHVALAEAVRLIATNLDPPMVECAKLEIFSMRPELFAGLGPVELLYRSSRSLEVVEFGIHDLRDGAELGTVEAPAEYMSRLNLRRASFLERFPKLFQGSFVSASRYMTSHIETVSPSLL